MTSNPEKRTFDAHEPRGGDGGGVEGSMAEQASHQATTRDRANLLWLPNLVHLGPLKIEQMMELRVDDDTTQTPRTPHGLDQCKTVYGYGAL
jgi:hypothetical protein